MRHSLLASAIAVGLLSQTIPAFAQQEGFVEGTTAKLDLRNFYFNQDNRSGDASPSRSEEWGQGLLLNIQSGYTRGTVGVGLDVLGQLGIRLDSGGRAGKDVKRAPGALFPLESDGSAVNNFGRLDFTGKVRLAKSELRIGTLLPKLPVLTYNDGRLLPQTFRGAHLTSRDIDRLTLHAGQIREVKGRASSDYEKLRVAGIGGSKRVNRFHFAGGEYRFNDQLSASYYFADLKDYYRQHYLGAVHQLPVGGGKLTTDVRHFNSKAKGANDDRDTGYGTEVDNRASSILTTYAHSGHSLGLGYQHLSGDSHFPFVNNGDGASTYLITDSQIGKFERAGEKTWLARYGYDFANAGLPGLKATATYLRGHDIDTQLGVRDREWERDLRIDYSIQDGFLKNVGFSLRHASLRSDVQRDRDEVRAIVSYSLALL